MSTALMLRMMKCMPVTCTMKPSKSILTQGSANIGDSHCSRPADCTRKLSCSVIEAPIEAIMIAWVGERTRGVKMPVCITAPSAAVDTAAIRNTAAMARLVCQLSASMNIMA